ncbi:unnamed protein product [Candida parapsilosis]
MILRSSKAAVLAAATANAHAHGHVQHPEHQSSATTPTPTPGTSRVVPRAGPRRKRDPALQQAKPTNVHMKDATRRLPKFPIYQTH